ncbi:MAG TPA: hypothetical protein VMR21_04090, partial [Vicinamibacteria bacterium]|nr:hypothetical protein [Vicinamibacteria bacterium]
VVNVNPEGPADGDTDFGLNLLAGLGARRGRVIPYAQAKVILKDSSEFVIAVGIRGSSDFAWIRSSPREWS